MPYIPHTDEETKAMLQAIGVQSIEELYEEIPASLRKNALPNIPEGLTEFEITALLQQQLKEDKLGTCFIGAGAYEHHIPAAVSSLISRGEFLTAYTPYQAEASQGNLQLIYEYQTMIASLMGMDVANASVYDGACALAEAILMAIRINKQKDKLILLPRAVHPAYRRVVKSIVRLQNVMVEEIDFDLKSGQTLLQTLEPYSKKSIAALVIPQPNFFGTLEEVDDLTNWGHQQGALVIGVVNPTSVALLKEPGQWGEKGADIACGEGQPLGIPLTSGGPYFGFMACKMPYIRQMPGRIVGRTVDSEGKQGFTLTLQAREQHIRRSKATSNICTNQGLMVTAATIYMSLVGAEGLRQTAAASHANAVTLFKKLTHVDQVESVFTKPFFHEFVIRFKKPIATIVERLGQCNIQGGFDLSKDYPELGHALLVCATDTKSSEDLTHYSQALRKIVQEQEHLEMCESQ